MTRDDIASRIRDIVDVVGQMGVTRGRQECLREGLAEAGALGLTDALEILEASGRASNEVGPAVDVR